MSKLKEILNGTKGKVEEVVGQAKDYDYKAKAKDIKETVSNYDYKEKAKEISETIKSYDYIGEAENIKKGGFKYFWNKHKKLSTVAIAVVLVLIIMTKFTGGGITEKSNGYRCFSMTKTEFAQEYNDVYYKLSGSDMYNPSKYPRLDEERCKTYEPNSTDVEVYPNMKVLYEYDTTLYSAYGQGKNSVLDISTDENENIVTLVVTRGTSTLGTEEAMNSFISVDCVAALCSLTGKSNSEALKLIDKVASDGIVEKEDNYEYLFSEGDGKTSFIIRVAN